MKDCHLEELVRWSYAYCCGDLFHTELMRSWAADGVAVGPVVVETVILQDQRLDFSLLRELFP